MHTLTRILRGHYQRAWYYADHYRLTLGAWAIGTVTFVVGFQTVSFEPAFETTMFIMGGIGYALALFDLVRVVRFRWKFTAVPSEKFKRMDFSKLRLPDGWTLNRNNSGTAIWNEKLNLELDLAENPIIYASTAYKLPAAAHRFKEAIIRTKVKVDTTNDRKIGLRSDVGMGVWTPTSLIEVQETGYFDALVTNEFCDRKIIPVGEIGLEGSSPYVGVDNAFREEDGLDIYSLEDSKNSNHIGITTFAITADQKIVRQTQGNQERDPDTFQASASGSCDWNDLTSLNQRSKQLATLQNIVRFSMQRELEEETGASLIGARTIVTGFSRILDRGGKPEFFGITLLNHRFNKMRIQKSEKRRVTKLEPFSLESADKFGVIRELEKFHEELKEPNRQGKNTTYYLTIESCLNYLRALSPEEDPIADFLKGKVL